MTKLPTTELTAIDTLVEAGWIELSGNNYVLTSAGQAALRKGVPEKSYGPTLPVDTVRARLKPSIKKKKHKK